MHRTFHAVIAAIFLTSCATTTTGTNLHEKGFFAIEFERKEFLSCNGDIYTLDRDFESEKVRNDQETMFQIKAITTDTGAIGPTGTTKATILPVSLKKSTDYKNCRFKMKQEGGHQ